MALGTGGTNQCGSERLIAGARYQVYRRCIGLAHAGTIVGPALQQEYGLDPSRNTCPFFVENYSELVQDCFVQYAKGFKSGVVVNFCARWCES